MCVFVCAQPVKVAEPDWKQALARYDVRTMTQSRSFLLALRHLSDSLIWWQSCQVVAKAIAEAKRIVVIGGGAVGTGERKALTCQSVRPQTWPQWPRGWLLTVVFRVLFACCAAAELAGDIKAYYPEKVRFCFSLPCSHCDFHCPDSPLGCRRASCAERYACAPRVAPGFVNDGRVSLLLLPHRSSLARVLLAQAFLPLMLLWHWYWCTQDVRQGGY